MFITDEWLKRKRACADQRKTFRRLFPDGCEVTVENAEKANRHGLDVIWAYVRCLDRKGRREFIRFCQGTSDPVRYTSYIDAGLAAYVAHSCPFKEWEWIVHYLADKGE